MRDLALDADEVRRLGYTINLRTTREDVERTLARLAALLR